jgi:hypothetical protein
MQKKYSDLYWMSLYKSFQNQLINRLLEIAFASRKHAWEKLSLAHIIGAVVIGNFLQ